MHHRSSWWLIIKDIAVRSFVNLGCLTNHAALWFILYNSLHKSVCMSEQKDACITSEKSLETILTTKIKKAELLDPQQKQRQPGRKMPILFSRSPIICIRIPSSDSHGGYMKESKKSKLTNQSNISKHETLKIRVHLHQCKIHLGIQIGNIQALADTAEPSVIPVNS